MSELNSLHVKMNAFLEVLDDLIVEMLADGVSKVAVRQTLLARAVLLFKSPEAAMHGIMWLDHYRKVLEQELALSSRQALDNPMFRTPSLRELRRDAPANVAILPSAPSRRVEQRYNDATRQAKRELIASQAVAFPYKLPADREAERLDEVAELRADVPPFDPSNPSHLRAWEAIWDCGQRSWESDRND